MKLNIKAGQTWHHIASNTQWEIVSVTRNDVHIIRAGTDGVDSSNHNKNYETELFIDNRWRMIKDTQRSQPDIYDILEKILQSDGDTR